MSEEAPEVQEEGAEDILLAPDGMTEGPEARLRHKEFCIVSDRPLASFTLPAGKTLHVWAQSEGQLERIDEAFQAWMDARFRASRSLGRRWRRWKRRRDRVETELTYVQSLKYEYFRRLFEEPYIKERHQDLTAEEFLSMPTDLEVAICDTHRRANDVSDLLRAILGPDVFDAKKKTLTSGISSGDTG